MAFKKANFQSNDDGTLKPLGIDMALSAVSGLETTRLYNVEGTTLSATTFWNNTLAPIQGLRKPLIVETKPTHSNARPDFKMNYGYSVVSFNSK